MWTFRWEPVNVQVRYDAATATLDPLTSDLAANITYLALVTTGVKDNEDTPLAENYSWTFTTGSA